jgi:anti-anti-sigma regulatory factor
MYVQTTDGGDIVIRLQDRINYSVGAKILSEIEPFRGKDVKHINIFCNELRHVSGEGIHALVRLKRETRANVVLHNMSKPLKDVFAIYLSEGHFVFEDEKSQEEQE